MEQGDFSFLSAKPCLHNTKMNMKTSFGRSGSVVAAQIFGVNESGVVREDAILYRRLC